MSTIRHFALFVLAALAVGSASTTRASPLDESYQTWLSATITHNPTPDLQLMLDVHGRFYDSFAPYQVLVRPSVGLRIAERMYVHLGYGWTPSWASKNSSMTDEHRLWEQWSWDIFAGAGPKLFLRSRLEQRIRPETSSDVGIRFRQMVRLLVPFYGGSPISFALWDEVFIDLNDSRVSAGARSAWQRDGFDQNRVFLGISWSPDPHVRVEVGYMNHFVSRTDVDQMHHVGMVNGFLTIK